MMEGEVVVMHHAIPPAPPDCGEAEGTDTEGKEKELHMMAPWGRRPRA